MPNKFDRFGNFLIFLVLTIVTIGIYPIYFAVTRMEEQTTLLRYIAKACDGK